MTMFRRSPARAPRTGIVRFLFGFMLFLAAALAQAAPSVTLTKTLSPPSPTAIPTGQVFTYALQWKCAGSISPTDDCINMQIVDVLPPYIQLVGHTPSPEVSSVTSTVDGSGITTVTVHFQPTVTPGVTGTVELFVSYAPGQTPDGVVSNNVASILANGAPTVVSSPPVTTTSVVNHLPVAEKLVRAHTAGNVLEYEIRYCGNATQATEGAMDITSATITDTLPPGTTFWAAVPTPTSAPPVGGTGTVTWNGLPGALHSDCGSVRLMLQTSLPAGSSVTNTADVNLTLWDGSTTLLQPSSTVTLDAPTGIGPGAATKAGNGQVFANGGPNWFNIAYTNNSNQYYDAVTIEDQFPPSSDVDYIQADFASAQDNQWFVQIDGGAWVDVTAHYAANNQRLTKGYLVSQGVMTSGQYITALRRIVPHVSPSTTADTAIRFYGLDPDRNGNPMTLPATVTNTASVVFTFDGVDEAPLYPSYGYQLLDPVPSIAPITFKASNNGYIVPGGTQGWRLFVGTNDDQAALVGVPTKLINPTVVDLLPAGFSYVGNLSFGNAANACQTSPQVTTVDDYDGTGRQLVVFSYAGQTPACEFGHTPNDFQGAFYISFDTKAAEGTPAGTYANSMAITNWENPVGTMVERSDPAFCANTVPDTRYAAPFTGSTGSADPGRICESTTASALVQSNASFASRKGVTGQLDGGVYQYSGSGQVATTVRGGTMLWTARITNTGNVDATNIDIVDILPTVENGSNTGVGTGAPMLSTWTPYFLTAVTPPPGGTVYYATDANPCRDNIVAVPGCQPMATLAPGVPQSAPGQWSTVLPADPRSVRSFRIHFGAAVLAGGQSLDFTWPMSAPADAPLATNGVDGTAATTDDTDVAWNTFGYSLDTSLGALNSAPTRVGIIVQDVPAATVASYGNYVWHDANRDGLQNEPAANGLNNVRVDLYRDEDGDGNPATGTQTFIGTQLTANDGGGNPGYYLFPGLPPGAYYAQFHPPAAYPDASPANVDGNGSDALDSDGQPVAGQPYLQSHVTTLVAGQDYRDTDQGFYDATVPTIDLTIAKTVTSSGPYTVGGTVTYSLVARNIGPAVAQAAIVVKDRLPAGLVLGAAGGPDWSCAPAGGAGPLEIACTRSASAAPLAAGTSAEAITVTATVAAGASGTLVNRAQVAPAAGEPLPESNPLASADGGYDDGSPATGSNNDDSQPIEVSAEPPSPPTPPSPPSPPDGGSPGAEPQPIPTLDAWMLLLLAAALVWLARPHLRTTRR